MTAILNGLEVTLDRDSISDYPTILPYSDSVDAHNEQAAMRPFEHPVAGWSCQWASSSRERAKPIDHFDAVTRRARREVLFLR